MTEKQLKTLKIQLEILNILNIGFIIVNILLILFLLFIIGQLGLNLTLLLDFQIEASYKHFSFY